MRLPIQPSPHQSLPETVDGAQVQLMDGVVGKSPDGSAYFAVPATWTMDHIGDFDGDGKSDLLWRGMNGSVHISYLNADVTIASTTAIAADGNRDIVSHGDYDGDGDADLLVRAGDGRHFTWLLSGSTVTVTEVIGANLAWALQPRLP